MVCASLDGLTEGCLDLGPLAREVRVGLDESTGQRQTNDQWRDEVYAHLSPAILRRWPPRSARTLADSGGIRPNGRARYVRSRTRRSVRVAAGRNGSPGCVKPGRAVGNRQPTRAGV